MGTVNNRARRRGPVKRRVYTKISLLVSRLEAHAGDIAEGVLRSQGCNGRKRIEGGCLSLEVGAWPAGTLEGEVRGGAGVRTLPRSDALNGRRDNGWQMQRAHGGFLAPAR